MAFFVKTNPSVTLGSGERYISRGIQNLPLPTPVNPAIEKFTEISESEYQAIGAELDILRADARNPADVLYVTLPPSFALATEPDTRPELVVTILNPPDPALVPPAPAATLPTVLINTDVEFRFTVVGQPTYADKLGVLFSGRDEKVPLLNFDAGEATRTKAKGNPLVFAQSGLYVLTSTASYKIQSSPQTMPVVE